MRVLRIKFNNFLILYLICMKKKTKYATCQIWYTHIHEQRFKNSLFLKQKKFINLRLMLLPLYRGEQKQNYGNFYFSNL